MEVEEENTSNHLQESTTAGKNEVLTENNGSNGEELEKEVSESNTREEEELSVTVPKLDDTKPYVAESVAETVGGAAEDGDEGGVKDEIPAGDVAAVEKDLIVECRNLESCGRGDPTVAESTNVVEDEGAVKDEIPSAGMATAECGGSESRNSGKIDGVEFEEAAIPPVESVKNTIEGTDTNGSLVIEKDKDGGEGETEAVKAEEDGGGVDVVVVPVADNGGRDEVMEDVKIDDGADKENIEVKQGDEAITEGQDDLQESVTAEVVKEEEIVADEEEPSMADEEATMADEPEKSLDTEPDTEEEPTMADEEKAPDTDIVSKTESRTKPNAEKRKRGGKNPKATPKSRTVRTKMIDEDVCFICFDGGNLVLCDHRNCPKAYHPSCVNRDEAFFQTKGRWNCGWHLCSICEKKAEYMCYTCTFSLCKACIKTNVLLCVREKEKKGFCETCMKTVMLIEKDSQENQGNVDFDDKSSWEYLFKDYWMDMKAKLNLSLDEILEAKNVWKGSELAGKDDGGSGSENPSYNLEPRRTRRRKANNRKSAGNAKEESVNTVAAAAVGSEKASMPENTEWASKELLEFVTHMRNGNNSLISQFDVQALLLEYIKTNNLRDSRRKSQIVCDARLQRLFGKPRVGHFEMLKLLESHFLVKEDCQMDDIQGSVVDNEVSQVDDDETNETPPKGGRDKKRRTRKKGDREPQSNREDYAAIDIHNISVIYLRRKLVEDLLDDSETFRDKIVGTFVRIRIPGAHHKNDIYRLVQVTGTTEGAQYTLGKKKTDTMLEIQNLNKTESISIDTISNQEFTEDECKRLRQSIKCGLINRLTVGDILDKAMEIQAARVNDWLETEVMRLSHLRDRASDLGRKKELRECVEKLQVLKTPEERARRLEEFPVIHVDHTMDPNYESEDETDTNDKKQDTYNSIGSGFSRRRDYPPKESWSGSGLGIPRSSGRNYEFTRNLSNKNFSNNVEDATSVHPEPRSESLRNQRRDTIVQKPSILKKPSSANDDVASQKDVPETSPKTNEMEKMWHYKDPSGKIQGPFSMAQLRKWSNNKYFPVELKIWRKNEKEDDGILLTDALEGRFRLVEMPNLPSPTPSLSVAGLGPVGLDAGLFSSSNEGLQSPMPSSAQNSEQQSHMVAPPQMVQPVASQNHSVGPHGWNGGAPQNPQPSPSSNMAGQPQLGYNHWGGVPNMVQNPGGNFLQPPPPPPPVNLPPPPPQPNGTWGAMPANPNIGLVGPTFQGNVNPTWVLQAGSVPAPPAQVVAPNQGWVGPLGNPGCGEPGPNHGPTNTTTSWVPGPGNQGAPMNPSPGPGNANRGPVWAQPRPQGAPVPPGNSSQGWGSPRPRAQPMWEGSGFSGQKRNRGSQGSGFRGDRRQWGRPGSFNNRGSRDSSRSSDR